MNTVVTSKEDILKTSRKLIQQQGWSAINIRSVAAACGVSVGSIYNYFDFAGITGDATFLGDYKTGYANAAVPEEAFHSGHGSACILCGLGSERIGDQR